MKCSRVWMSGADGGNGVVFLRRFLILKLVPNDL